MNDLIDKLIYQRHCKGLTQKELAELTNLTQSVIARFENKKVSPNLETLMKIATALECKIDIIPTNCP